MFIGKQIEFEFEFDNELIFLTEITFDNQPAMIVNTTLPTNNCQLGERIYLTKYLILIIDLFLSIDHLKIRKSI